ncbi:MAG: sensor histidine kinase [Chloroflexi bacterium]|nr:sensor histidine kinase [Chloroflexota bacterium]
MPDLKARPRLEIINTTDDVAFVVVVIAAYIATLFVAPDAFAFPNGLIFIAAGILFLIVGIYGFSFCKGRFPQLGIALYFAIQIPLSFLIMYLGRSNAWLVLLPLISQAAFLNRAWMISISLLILATFMLALTVLSNWETAAKSIILFFPAVVFVIIFSGVVAREQRARAEVERLAKELSDANIKLREYAAQVEELATTKERNRLAREIHDGLGHYLTAINMQIEAARAVIETDRTRAVDAMAKAQSLTKEGLTEVRRSVAALRASPIENRPLRNALTKLIDECRASGIVTEFVVTGTPRPLPPQTELALYRVVEESLTNVRKHAHAPRVDLGIDYGANQVRLTIKDNGVGTSDASGGFGLLGIRERVQLVGGSMHIDTARGQGFALEVEVPQ